MAGTTKGQTGTERNRKWRENLKAKGNGQNILHQRKKPRSRQEKADKKLKECLGKRKQRLVKRLSSTGNMESPAYKSKQSFSAAVNRGKQLLPAGSITKRAVVNKLSILEAAPELEKLWEGICMIPGTQKFHQFSVVSDEELVASKRVSISRSVFSFDLRTGQSSQSEKASSDLSMVPPVHV